MGARLHRIVIGRSREVRGPDALESAVVGVIVVVVMMVAMEFGVRATLMAQTLDAVSFARGAQVNAVIYYAEHGRWPAPGSPDIVGADGRGSFFEQLTLDEGGAMTAELALGGIRAVPDGNGIRASGKLRGSLSFRPELLGARDAPSISFLCGYAKPMAGAVAAGAVNRTSMSPDYLPPFCR